MKIKILYTLCLMFYLPMLVMAQTQTIRGKIIDSRDQTPLSYSSIAIKNTTKGTIADSLGRFVLRNVTSKDVLIFSSLGYESQLVMVEDFISKYRGIVKLQPNAQNLTDVVIRPEENPAWAIIRKVLKNRPLNDPEKLQSYRANTYTKITTHVDSLKLKLKKTDTTEKTLSATVFVQENYAEILYKAPDKRKETIIASMSNLPSIYAHLLNNFPLDINPLGFYKDLYNFTLLKRFYTNPINPQTFKQYDFEIQDTLYHATDSTFVITFRPYKGVNFEGFTGVMHINTDGYALEKIQAKSADTLQILSFQINQRYARTQGKWFPAYSSIDLWANHHQKRLNGYASMQIATTYEKVILNEPIDANKFNETNREMRTDAIKTNPEEFKQYRLDSLSVKEDFAYKALKMSKMGQKVLKADSVASPILLGIVSGVFEWKKVELIPNYLLMVNPYEKFRIGVGFQNNQSLRPAIRMMGAVGYGFRDKQLKYRGLLSWNITPDRYNRLSIYADRDYAVPANTYFLEPNYYKETVRTLPYSFGDSIPYRADFVKSYGTSLHFKPWAYTWAQLALEHESRQPVYAYQFNEKNEFQNTAVRLDIRFAYKEIFSRIGRMENIINRWFPIINLQVVKGLAFWGGDYDYWKISGVAQHQIRYKRMGYTHIELEGGYVVGNVPYPYLFAVRGLRGTLTLMNSANTGTFRTLPFGYFLSDQYSLLSVRHNFGRTLIRPRSKYFQPQISVYNKAIYGSLSQQNLHQLIDFQTLEKGYFEAGIEIRDIIRIPIKGLFIGTGLGVACGYGPNAAAQLKDNLRIYWLGMMPSF